MAGNSRKVNVEVAISGENKYKQAISELNAANKTMGAELKRLSAEYQDNSESMEFLSKKGETLQTMLDHQKEKVEQLKEAVKFAAQQYGEASTKTQSYAAQLANAETSVISLEQAIEENNKAIERQKYSTSEYDEQLRVLASELKEIDSEMAAGADTVETLRAKNETLNEILTVQQEKYKTLCAALKEAEESGSATAKEINDLKVQVNEAATAYNQTSAAIQQNNQALEENLARIGSEEQGLTGIGDALDGLTQKFGVNLPDAAKSALNSMGSFSSGTVAAVGAAAAAIVALYEGVKKLHEMTVEYAAKADELITQSMVSGVSVQTLQELKYAENLIDVSVETITGSLTRLTANMRKAIDGNKEMQESFSNLGVSIRDSSGQLRNAEEVFYDLIDALGQIENPTERDAVAMELLGKSAKDLNPLIIQGTDALKELREEAQDLYVLTDDQIAILGELDDQVQKNSLTWEALKQELAVQFAPASKEALENFRQLVEAAGKALIDSKIIEGVGEIFQYLSAMLQPLSSLLGTADGAKQRLTPLYEVLHGIAGALAWAADAANVLVGMLQTLSIVGAKEGLNRIGTALGYGASSGNYSNMQKWMGMDDTTGNYYNPNTGRWEGNYGRNAGGTDNWRGGLTWVGEAGPELVALPRGSQIMSAQESRNAGGDVYIDQIVIDAKSVKEFNDIIRIIRSERVTERMGIKK